MHRESERAATCTDGSHAGRHTRLIHVKKEAAAQAAVSVDVFRVLLLPPGVLFLPRYLIAPESLVPLSAFFRLSINYLRFIESPSGVVEGLKYLTPPGSTLFSLSFAFPRLQITLITDFSKLRSSRTSHLQQLF